MKTAALILLFLVSGCIEQSSPGRASSPTVSSCEEPEPLECRVAAFIPFDGEGVSLLEIRNNVEWDGQPARIPEVVELLETYDLRYDWGTERYGWIDSFRQREALNHFCIDPEAYYSENRSPDGG